MRPVYAARRVDATAKALTAEAKRLGCGVAPLGGAVDSIWWIGSTLRLVDYKSIGGTLTASQSRLLARGAPVRFLRTIDEVRALVHEMRVEAGLSDGKIAERSSADNT